MHVQRKEGLILVSEIKNVCGEKVSQLSPDRTIRWGTGNGALQKGISGRRISIRTGKGLGKCICM